MRKKCPSLGRYPIVYCHCQAHAPAYPPGFICIAYSNSWRIHPKPAAVTLQMLLCPVPFFNFSIDCVVIFTVLLYKYKCAILATPYHFGLCFLYIRPIPFTFRNSQLKWFTLPHTNGKSLFHWPKPASSVIAS